MAASTGTILPNAPKPTTDIEYPLEELLRYFSNGSGSDSPVGFESEQKVLASPCQKHR